MEQATFRNLILRDVEAANAEEAIRKVGQRFYDEGFVKDTYIDAVVAREKNYATGLQLADIAVAMPHTDPQHVNRPGVCIAQLKHPVEFEHMGDPDTKVQAEMLFMMAIKNPDESSCCRRCSAYSSSRRSLLHSAQQKMKTSCSRRLRSTLVDYRTEVLFKTRLHLIYWRVK